MARPAVKTIQIHEGKINLHKRNKSPIWHCAYTINKTLIRQTTGTDDLSKAKEIAFEKYMTARILHKEGHPFAPRAFNAIAEAVIKKMEAEQETQQTNTEAPVNQTYIAFLNNYAIPFFSSTPIQSINKEKLAEFDIYRKKEMEKQPSATTVKMHNTAMYKVYDYAVDKKYISRTDVPVIENTGTKQEPRKEFTEEEYKKIIEFMRTDWLNDDVVGSRIHESKLLLKDYVMFIYNTGCRPGTETKGLRFKHIRTYKQDGIEYIGISVDGKTGRREIVPKHDIYLPLQNLVNRRNTFRQLKGKNTEQITLQEVLELKSEEFVFASPKGVEYNSFGELFAEMLEACNMRIDPRTNEKRVLYSLRHSYATNAIMEGKDVYMLAKNMGTSLQMIKDHYDHALSIAHSRALAGEEK